MDSGNENDSRLLETRVLPNHIRQFEAVNLRHADIHQDNRNIPFEKIFERLSAGIGLDQILSKLLEYDFITE